MSTKRSYVAPRALVVGKLQNLTGDSGGDDSSEGNGFGKGSLCADGQSGLIGNRSYNSGSCAYTDNT